MASTRWNELDPRSRQALLVAGAFDAGLKIAALIDLSRRPREDIRGSKAVWAIALTFVNSSGILPIIYFLRGYRIG
jgi:hypothetical protein